MELLKNMHPNRKRTHMNIQIPEPCHEDWAKMNQEEKGKFCGVCSKTVVDFSKFSDVDLVNYFKKVPKQEKICGRFATTQIDKKLEIKGDKYSAFTPVKKFAIAAFFIFGLTLFSCKSVEPEHHIVGEIAQIEQVEDTTLQTTTTTTVTPLPEEGVVGLIAIEPQECEIKMGKVKVVEEERDFIKGDIAIEPERPDTANKIKAPDENLLHTMGGPRINYDK